MTTPEESIGISTVRRRYPQHTHFACCLLQMTRPISTFQHHSYFSKYDAKLFFLNKFNNLLQGAQRFQQESVLVDFYYYNFQFSLSLYIYNNNHMSNLSFHLSKTLIKRQTCILKFHSNAMKVFVILSLFKYIVCSLGLQRKTFFNHGILPQPAKEISHWLENNLIVCNNRQKSTDIV